MELWHAESTSELEGPFERKSEAVPRMPNVITGGGGSKTPIAPQNESRKWLKDQSVDRDGRGRGGLAPSGPSTPNQHIKQRRERASSNEPFCAQISRGRG